MHVGRWEDPRTNAPYMGLGSTLVTAYKTLQDPSTLPIAPRSSPTIEEHYFRNLPHSVPVFLTLPISATANKTLVIRIPHKIPTVHQLPSLNSPLNIRNTRYYVLAPSLKGLIKIGASMNGQLYLLCSCLFRPHKSRS